MTKSEAKTSEFDANTEPVLRTLLLTRSEAKTPEFDANPWFSYDLVLRFKSDAKIYRNWTQIKAIY